MKMILQVVFNFALFLLFSNALTLPDDVQRACGPLPPPPENSRYHRDDNNNKLKVLCNDGYYREGFPEVKCDNYTGRWNTNVTCYLKACGHPGKPKNGAVVGTLYHVGAKVSYSCGDCFIMEGDNERTCLSNETWSGKMPSCKHIECGTLVEGRLIENGYVHSEHNTCGSEIEFFCNDGYELIGNKTSRCGADSAWTSEAPFCNRKQSARIITDAKQTEEIPTPVVPTDPPMSTQCKELDLPDNGYIMGLKETGVYENGDILSFFCDAQYELQGAEDLFCEADGFWSAPPPTCRLSYCDEKEAAAPSGGHRVGGNFIGQTFKYFCEPHSRLLGQKEITCGPDGEWSQKPPICKPLCDYVKCKEDKQCKYDYKSRQTSCVCKKVEDCPAVYEPVCGSDGVTYNNECIMKSYACIGQRKIKVVAQGSCIPGGICGIKPLSFCRGYFEVFYFNPESQSCEEIVVGGCHKSGWNGFETSEECHDTCKMSSTGPLCSRPADRGPCTNFRNNWYHDAKGNKCKQFVYGGCFGNQNNFETEEDCIKVCRPVNVSTTMRASTEQATRKSTEMPRRSEMQESTTMPMPKTTQMPTSSEEMRNTEQPETKTCPRCRKTVDLCERIKTSDYTITGKLISEEIDVFKIKVTGIFKDPKEIIQSVNSEVKVKKLPSDVNCPCLPKPPKGELVIAGDYSTSDDDDDDDGDMMFSISDGDHIGKYYGAKQFACAKEN